MRLLQNYEQLRFLAKYVLNARLYSYIYAFLINYFVYISENYYNKSKIKVKKMKKYCS